MSATRKFRVSGGSVMRAMLVWLDVAVSSCDSKSDQHDLQGAARSIIVIVRIQVSRGGRLV